MKYASHVVVDTRDGYVFWTDVDTVQGHITERLFDEGRARTFANKRNSELKPEFRAYRVFELVPVKHELQWVMRESLAFKSGCTCGWQGFPQIMERDAHKEWAEHVSAK